MRSYSVLTMLILLVSAVWLTGCESSEMQQVVAHEQAETAGQTIEEGDFQASVTLCRKVGRKTGKRIGKSRSYSIDPVVEGRKPKKQYVYGLVDFENVSTDRIYPVHLVWIKPGGKEMFRKYAEVEVTATENGYQAQIKRLKAIDLHYLKEKIVESETPSFSLDIRLNISADKEREPGQYLFRVYLDRRLLLEEPFEVTQG